MPRHKTKRRRGRPEKAHAKRRQTTRIGRITGFDPVIETTIEIKARRKAATGREDLPHDDPLATLYGHGLLSLEQYNTGRSVAELISQTRRDGVVSSVWQRILGAPGGGIVEPGLSPAAERAARMVTRIARELGASGIQLFGVCGGVWMPWIIHVAQGRTLRRYERDDLDRLRTSLDRMARFWTPTNQQ